MGFGKFGSDSIIVPPFKIWNKERINIGKKVFIAENAFFAVSTSFRNQKFNPLVSIGNKVQIGSNFVLGAINGVTIENDVTIADRVFISDHIHGYTNIKLPIAKQPLESKGKVVIGSGSFIGVNAVIMPGVKMGKNSVVGASSVVTKSIPDFAVAAGIPAKVIKKYNIKKRVWEKIK